MDRKRLMIATDLARTAVVAIPSLVPSSDDLVTANGRVHAGYSAAQIAGPLLAGLLITVAPVQQVLWVAAASFLVSAGTLLLIGASFNAPRNQEARRAIRHEILDGLRHVLGHPVLRNISAMMALINLVGPPCTPSWWSSPSASWTPATAAWPCCMRPAAPERRLVDGIIGALVALLALAFSFGPLGHADRYLPASQPAHTDTP